MLLVELAVVVGILILILALSLPQFSFLERRMIKVELEKLSAVCKYLQQRSIARNEPETMTFDIAKGIYYVGKVPERLAQGVLFGFLPGTLGPPSQPTSAITSPITFDNKQITFYPDGTMQAGTIYLIDRSKRTMGALTASVGHVSYLRKYAFGKGWTLLP